MDMASYKSEFLYQHYRGRRRPRSHHSLGALPRWLRMSWRIAPLSNGLMRRRTTRRLFAAIAGISSERAIPPIARVPFTHGHDPLAVRTTGQRGSITLWPDTFTNYLAPEVGHAAVRVAADAGYAVAVPVDPVCCGLTWITTGQLDSARAVLRRTLDAPAMAGDDPLVVLEPSCAASLKVDLPELLPDDPRAAALAARVTTFAELLDRIEYQGPAAAGGDAPQPALSQPHCHQQAVLGTAADSRVLARNGIPVGTTLTGCCGLAGNFGAERGHEIISRQVAELELVPALEAAGPDVPIMADGFSCRTQIAALSGRQCPPPRGSPRRPARRAWAMTLRS